MPIRPVTDPSILAQLNHGSVVAPNPMFPGQIQGQALSNQRTQQEISQAQATAAATTARTKAEAQSAQLAAKSAQEAYDSAHPKGSNATVLGPESLKSLSPPDQEIVKALAEGRLAFPAGFALKAPWWQQKLEQVAAYDPTFDATNFNNRAKARAMLLTGKVGMSANALNTAIGHLGLLNDQISGTASHNFTPANAVINKFEQLTGDPGITNFKDTAGKLASELTSVYRNGGGAEQDVIRQLESLDPNASEAQKRAVVRNALDLLASKQAANLYQYGIGSGGKPPVDLLDPDAHKILDQFPDIRDKHFGGPTQAITPQAAALLQRNGGTPPPGTPPAAPSGNDAPRVGPSAPHADYSGMVGGPQAGLVQSDPTSKLGALKQTYRTEFDPAMANVIGSFIRKGVPLKTAANYAQSQGYLPPDENAYRAAVQYARDHRGAVNVSANKNVATTLGERLSSSPAAAALAGAVSGGTAGLADVAGRTLAGPGWDANRAALSATQPGYDLGGNVLGGAAGMFAGGTGLSALLRAGAKGGVARGALALASKNPILSSILGDTAYSTTYGAAENPDNPMAGAGLGAVLGPAASLGGQTLAKGAGSALRGVADPAVQRLQAAGIPLTVGEILGGGAKKAQDALTSVFGPGNMVSRRYADGRQALNQAAFNQAGQTVGAPINKVGQAGINALDTAKNNAYSQALDPISLNLNDPNFVDSMQGAIDAADKIPGAELPEGYGGVAIRHYIGNQVSPDGTMSGPQFQAAYRGLAQTANKAAPKIEGHDIGQAIGQAKDALTAALQEQNPGAYAGFLNANAANRQLNILANAVNAAKNQVGDSGEPLFTPAQLGTAASANAKKYGGNIQAAMGNRPFNQLSLDAQKVMSSRLPESGTFPRALLAGILTGGVMSGGGAAGGYAGGGSGAAEGALAPLALLTLLGTRRGQQLLAGALTKRTATDRWAGRALSRTPQVGGDVLTAAGIPLLSGP